jgi:hypothetical protein
MEQLHVRGKLRDRVARRIDADEQERNVLGPPGPEIAPPQLFFNLGVEIG